MLIDLRQLAGDESFEADVCVAGAGAAGLTMARELAAAGHSVIVVESGGLVAEPPTQALYSGTEAGTLLGPKTGYLGSSRLRYFGGTTGHWNGWCRPLDADDFTSRPWVADVPWPISREELTPYYDRASPILQISPFDYEQATAGVEPKIFDEDDAFETNFFHLSPPTRFGEFYRQELDESDRVKVILYANLRRIEMSDDARRVQGFEVVRLDGQAFPVHARQFVLAAGGIENARLLMANRDVQPEGLGNDFDQVGRYFMDHPFLRVGYMVLPYWRGLIDKNYVKSYVRSRDNEIHGVLRLRSAVRARDELLNSLVIFQPLTNAQNRPLAADIARFVTQQHRLAGHPEPEEGSTYYGWVLVHGEQAPNPASRVMLSDETDSIGVPRTRLDWRLQERDARSLVKTAELFAHRLGAHSRGRMRLIATEEDLWERAQWSWHHIGTTRMHADPKRGVVDADCRVHGIDNLFVAGSSVFPTSGASNPTYTIVALALRLGDHLKTLLAA